MKALGGLLRTRQVETVARWLLGLVFVASSLGKIVDPAAFADNIAAYHLLPLAVVNVIAIVMTWTELLVGLSLLNGVAARSGALLAAAMNVVFIVAAASGMARGLDIECGCFSVAKSTVGWGLIGRDIVFLAMALLVLFHRPADALRPGSATTAPEAVLLADA